MQDKRRFVHFPHVVLVTAMALAVAGATVIAFRTPAVRPPATADEAFRIPLDDPRLPPPSPTPSPIPRRRPVRRLAPPHRAVPKPKPAAPSLDLSAFRGLATWYDTYDYGSADPFEATRSMHAYGVRALFIQTGRYTLPGTFKDPVEMAAWIRAAHANGMKIVGWYLPGYGNLARDVARTAAIASFRTGDGQRFDALGVDVEDKCEIKGSTCNGVKPSPTMDAAGWNAAIVTHMLRVRSSVGALFPMAGIVPPPLGMAIRPSHWTGFPWRSLPRGYDVLVPMAYWSYRDDCASVPQHCAYGYTRDDVDQVRSLTGSATIPVHVAGGVADSVDAKEVADFVRGARDARAIGGSLYDYRTTEPAYWAALGSLDRL
jgi:hypothetical protein